MSEVEKEFPGSITWLITHPRVTIAIEFVVLLLILIALVSIQDALTSRL